MLSLSVDIQNEVIEALNSTFRYLEDQLNSDNKFLIKKSIIFALQNFS